MRIRHDKVEPSNSDNLFEKDLLGREEPIKVLTAVISSTKGPCVVAVDAEWGAGKTTFLDLWAEYLRREKHLGRKKCTVVRYNAWKTDYADHPFVPLANAMISAIAKTSGFREAFPAELGAAFATWWKKKIVKRKIKGLGKKLSLSLSISFFGIRIGVTRHQKTKKSVDKFKTSLQEAVASEQIGRMVIFVDELDRCRPPYAIKVLEVTKHLFDVDDVVFVFGLNQAQLRHSLRVTYGISEDRDQDDYFGRFFDLRFTLPASNRDKFVDVHLDKTKLNAMLGSNDKAKTAYDWLRSYLLSQSIDIRSVAQFTHRAQILLTGKEVRDYESAIIVALIIKTSDSEVYRRILQGAILDKEAYGTLRRQPSIESWIKSLSDSEAHSFEAAVIAACHEMADDKSVEQPLLQEYRKLCSATDDASVEHQRARDICKEVDEFNASGFGFDNATKRIELISIQHSGLALRQEQGHE